MAQKEVALEYKTPLLEEISKTRLNLEQLVGAFHAGVRDQNLIGEYNAHRINLITLTLALHKVTWCTHCYKIFPAKDAVIILLEGAEEVRAHYVESFVWFRDFSYIHRTCQTCYKQALSKHGEQGAYRPGQEARSKFCVFNIEERPDGYYVSKDEEWIKLSNKDYVLPELPRTLIEFFAKKWDIPARIQLWGQGEDGKEMLVIHVQPNTNLL